VLSLTERVLVDSRSAAVKLSDIPPLTIKKLSGLGGKVCHVVVGWLVGWLVGV